SDKHNIAAPGATREAAKTAELTRIKPMVRTLGEVVDGCGAAHRKEHYTTATGRDMIGDRQRQASATAHERERSILAHGSRDAHVSSSPPRRLIAMVTGRLLARMKAIIALTCGSSFDSLSKRSSRARNSPDPKNSASYARRRLRIWVFAMPFRRMPMTLSPTRCAS